MLPEDVKLITKQQMFQHDGVSTYYHRTARALNEKFLNRWIKPAVAKFPSRSPMEILLNSISVT